ncbi:sigma-70 family RNA polymerase sigma factor [Marinobacter halodurans]|uniref:sigma-70 family RNA polymerase sigma factor n=1 Tax=Marinobacter halodurans TaxID=2528979 RepID=UPI0013F16A58|nr:sigma-70 family RNA polymerase sigma factor [Marinobacter halodurans]
MHPLGRDELAEQRRRLLAAYREYERLLIDSAQVMMGCRSRAEDVVQDAFLKLWEQGTGRGVQDEGRYLFRVVRNLAIDRLRRLSLEKRHSACSSLMAQEPAPPSASPEQRMVGSDALQQVLAALAELPARMQRVLVLSRLEGRTQRDVARHLGVSPTLVNFMLRDTLAHCRNRLEAGRTA